MGGGKAGREEGHRTHQHYVDDDEDDEDDFLLRFCCIVSHNGEKIEIELVAFVIIIFLHTLLKVR